MDKETDAILGWEGLNHHIFKEQSYKNKTKQFILHSSKRKNGGMWVEDMKSHTLAQSREELANDWNCLEI